MKRTILVCVLALGAMAGFQILSGGLGADSPKVDIPFGTLVKGSPCSAATHMILSPCFPYPPTFFVVFPDGKNVTRYEGQNVTVRGTVDQASCSLPLIQASRVALSKVLPDCPP
jgi:hypothetical protein